VVRSILSQDSDRPVDEASVLWSDEEEDETVDNMVELINSNYTFVHSMFVGGVTKMEVDHMRENSKPAMKTKESKQHSSSTVDIDPGFVGSLVIEHIKPHVAVMELKLNQTSRRIDSIESYLTGYLESLMGKFKEEMLQTITSMVITYLGKGHSAAPHDPHLNPPETHNFVSGNLPYMIPLADDNAKSIRNVMENLSDYSTPPSSPRNCQAENTLSPTIALGQSGLLMSAPVYQGMAHSAHSQNHIRQIDMNQLSGVDKVVPRDLMDMPSFTLGITQEENMKGAGEGVVKESVNGSPLPDLNFADNIEDPQTSRKSKRQKMVPSDLVENYHCGPHILSRLRRSQKFVFIWYDQREVERKFLKLSHQLACNSVINVAGLSVSSKEIILIAERSRIFPPKVVDILIHLVRSVVLQHLSNENLHSCYFLDTKFGSALVRSYPKFKKLKNKESYSFPKGVLALVNDDGGTPLQARGYYFPFSLGKEHWVGVYFDTVQGHLSVLDCNMSYSNEASVAKFLTPLLHMLPYLSTRGSMDIVREEVMPFRFDRPKVVSQIDHLPDSGLMAVLLMVTHAVYGIDACKNISTTSLSEEGKSAAIMAYEFKEKL
ncbi:unnamed protein product, partial [Brassica napus]